MRLFDQLQQYHIEACRRMKLSIEQLWIIERMVLGASVESNREYRMLETRLFISNGSLTAIARDVYCGIISMEKPLEGKKISKPKVQMPGIEKYKEAWKKFWDTWPSTRSVPGTQFKSGAVMKKDEARMYLKWLTAIEGKITIGQLQYAAECYLQWAYEDSKKNGRNELQYRSSMEPWLHGEIYQNYRNLEMPVQRGIEKQQVYNNSTDQ